MAFEMKDDNYRFLSVSNTFSEHEVEFLATDTNGMSVRVNINEEQARDLVRYLNRTFDLGLRG